MTSKWGFVRSADFLPYGWWLIKSWIFFIIRKAKQQKHQKHHKSNDQNKIIRKALIITWVLEKLWSYNQLRIFSKIVEDVKSDLEVLSTRKVRDGHNFERYSINTLPQNSKSLFSLSPKFYSHENRFFYSGN